MRFSVGAVANAAAWGVIVLLIGAAALMVNRLGFMGLLLLGSATWLVCTMAELDQDAPIGLTNHLVPRCDEEAARHRD